MLDEPDAHLRVDEIGHQLGQHGHYPDEEDPQRVLALSESFEIVAEQHAAGSCVLVRPAASGTAAVAEGNLAVAGDRLEVVDRPLPPRGPRGRELLDNDRPAWAPIVVEERLLRDRADAFYGRQCQHATEKGGSGAEEL